MTAGCCYLEISKYVCKCFLRHHPCVLRYQEFFFFRWNVWRLKLIWTVHLTSVPTSQRILIISVRKTDPLVFGENRHFFCENHTRHKCTTWATLRVSFFMLKSVLDIVAAMLHNCNLLPKVRKQAIPSAVICERHHVNIHILFILDVGWDWVCGAVANLLIAYQMDNTLVNLGHVWDNDWKERSM